MNDALGMYLVITAEHEALLAELAERERLRGFPPARARATRTRRLRALVGRLARLARRREPRLVETAG
jgi:hypothetical protein